MAIVNWKNSVSGNWTIAADWSTGSVPGVADSAILGLSGTYTVSITSPIAVGSIAIANSAATLSVNAAGQTVTVAGALIDGGTLLVDVSGGQGGTTLAIDGSLTGNGGVTIGNGSLSSSTLVTADAFTDTGPLAITGSASQQATLDVTAGAAPAVLTSTITLYGDLLLEFASGGITSIAAGGKLVLNGNAALVADASNTTHNSALTTLTSIAGDLELENGPSVAIAGSLAVTGMLRIDASPGDFGSTLGIGGDFDNSGTVTVGQTYDAGGSAFTIAGTLNNSGSFSILSDLTSVLTTVTAAALDNTGSLDLEAYRGTNGNGSAKAVLDITAGAAPGVLASTITLYGNSLLEFASGGITSIAAGGKLLVSGTSLVADAFDTTHNSALTGLASVAGIFEVQSGDTVTIGGSLAVTGTLGVDASPGDFGSTLGIGGDFDNSGTVTVGQTYDAGGSAFTIAGTLDNSGSFSILSDLTSVLTTVTAAALDNTGSLDLDANRGANGNGSAEVVLDITAGAAPGALASTITLYGNSLLEFASGGITSIAAGGKLLVSGTSLVADAFDTTHNSALTGLASVAGIFEVQSGDTVTIGGSLAVTGTLGVDASPGDFGSTLSIGGDFDNSGTVTVGQTYDAGGSAFTIAGTLDNSGSFSILSDLTSVLTTVTAAALDNTGSLDLDANRGANGNGSAEVVLDITAGAAPGVLASTITLYGNSLLEFASGGITSIAAGGKLLVSGTSLVADAFDTTHNSALTGLASVAGIFDVQSGDTVAIAGSLAVTGTLGVDASPGDFGSTLGIGGDLDNTGTVTVGQTYDAGGSAFTIAGTLNNGGSFSILADLTSVQTTVTAAALDNTGNLDLEAYRGTNGNGSAKAVLDITAGAAPGVLASTITLYGNSLLEFATGGITSIAAGGKLTIGNSTSFIADSTDLTHNSALSGLQSIAGTLTLQGGSAVTTIGALAVSGTLTLQGSAVTTGGAVTVSGNSASVSIDASSGLTVGGAGFTQTGGNTKVSGALNASLIDVAGGELDEANGVAGQAFEVGGEGVLEFGGAVDVASTVNFADATGTIQLDKPGSFAATVDGAQVGDAIHLVNIAATGLNYANGVLTVLDSSGAVAALNFSGSYTNSDFGLVSDGSGGTYVVVEHPAPPTLWIVASSGSWTTASEWSTDTTPTATTDVLIGVPGSYTVTLSGTSTTGAARSIAIDDSNARLEIDSATLTIALDVDNVGSFVLEGPGGDGANVTVGGDVLSTGYIGVDDGSFGTGGSTLTIQGTLTSSGRIQVGGDYRGGIGTGAPATLITEDLDNTGSILIEGAIGAQATLDVVAGVAPATLTSSIDVRGVALLEYATGEITAVAASGSLTLGGANSFIADSGTTSSDSALAELSSNAGDISFDTGSTLTISPIGGTFDNSGSFVLEGGPPPVPGADVTIAGDVLNTDYIGVDDGSFGTGGSTLTIQGTLTSSGRIQVGGDYRGGIGTGAPATLITEDLDNTGSILIEGATGAQATLDVVAGVAPTTLTTSIDVRGTALLEYATGEIMAVAASGSLTLGGVDSFIADSGTTNSDSALAELSSNAGDISFDTGSTLTISPIGGTFDNSGSFVLEGGPPPVPGANVTVAGDVLNTGYIGVDDGSFGVGGSTLTIQGTLTSSGRIQVGGDYRGGIGTGAPATLITQDLDNTGSILVEGDPGAQATIEVAVAPTTFYGSIDLRGVSVLEFDSGSITAIAAAASLTLEGPNAFVAATSAPSANGGLSGLTSNAGTLTLLDSSLSLNGDLANTGTLDFDAGGSGGSIVSIAGTVTDTGKFVIGNSSLTAATTVNAAGLNEQGALSLTGSASARATLDISGAAQSTLNTTITLATNALLEFGSGSFSTIALGASLTLEGGAAIVADSNNLNTDSALSSLANVVGTLSLLDGAAVSVTGDLANTGSLEIDQSGNSTGASSLDVAGTLDNQTITTIGNGNLGANSQVTVGALDNEADATITASAGANGATAGLTVKGNAVNAGNFAVDPGGFIEAGSLDNEGILDVTGSASAPANVGVIGNATNEGAITIGAFAQLGVNGTFTNSGNIEIAGSLDLANGLTVTAAGSVLLQGGNIIDPPGVATDVGASIAGYGTIIGALENDGTVSASGGLLDLAGAVSGAGQLNIGSGAVLEIGGATSEDVAFGGNVGTLKLDDPAGFTGAITGFVQGDAVDLAGMQATSAVINGSTLTVTAGSQTLSYQVSGPGLAHNVFAVENDRQGGSDLVLGPPGPVINGPSTQIVFTGLPAVLGPLGITDPSAGDSPLMVTVSDTAGLLSTVATGAGTVGGSGTNALTLTGDLDDINTMLASLTYGGAGAGSDTVDVQVTDAGNRTTEQNIAVTDEAVPFTRPEVNAPAQELVIIGTSTAFGGITVSDPFAEATDEPVSLKANIQLATTSVASPVTLIASGPSGSTITGQDTDDLTITGTVDQVDADLADPVEALIPQIQQGIVNVAIALNIIITSGAAPNNELANAINEALSQIGEAVKIQAEITEATEAIVVTEEATGLTNLATFAGQFYDFNASGEFVLAQSTQLGDFFRVEVRLQPYNNSSAISAITEVAAGIGADRVTVGIGRTDAVWVNGIAAPMTAGETITLTAGQITELSATSYLLSWTTGEVVTVTVNDSYLDVDLGLPSGDAPGSIVGLMGPNGEPPTDTFELPDGAVLQQPLTAAELYGAFANAWRVTQPTSLFDYATGQNTGTFTDLNFPSASIDLADLPAAIVAQAAQAVAAAGITNPAVAAAAEFDYIASGGNVNVLADEAGQFQGLTATTTTITPSGSPPTALGVIAAQPLVDEAQNGSTAVTFDVYLTEPETSDTEVGYVVIFPDVIDFTAQDFGGLLPTGEITIAAGNTEGQFTIDVPQGALGTTPDKNVVVQISTPGSVPIFASTAQAEVTQPVAGPPAVPQLEDLTNFGDFSQVGNNYTLDLGAIQLGETLPTLQFGIVNAADAPADQLDGTFRWSTVVGFDVSVDDDTTSGAKSSLTNQRWR